MNYKKVQMVSDEWQISNYDAVGNHPVCWILTADDLLCAATILKEKRIHFYKNTAFTLAANQPIPPEGRILNSEIMLKGFAVECLLKAIWVKNGNVLATNGRLQKIPNVGSHKLVQLVTKLGISISPQQKDLLNRLEIFLTATGRYPVATAWETTKLTNSPKGPPTRWAMPADDNIYDSLVTLFKEKCAV